METVSMFGPETIICPYCKELYTGDFSHTLYGIMKCKLCDKTFAYLPYKGGANMNNRLKRDTLLYLKSCIVNNLGCVDILNLNTEALEIVNVWHAEKHITIKNIIEPGYGSFLLHVTFSNEAWLDAYQIEREIAEKKIAQVDIQTQPYHIKQKGEAINGKQE